MLSKKEAFWVLISAVLVVTCIVVGSILERQTTLNNLKPSPTPHVSTSDEIIASYDARFSKMTCSDLANEENVQQALVDAGDPNANTAIMLLWDYEARRGCDHFIIKG